jgi:hypothetical protein
MIQSMTSAEFAKLIVDEIESWDDQHQFHAVYDNDGDGHFDFHGLRVYDAGRKALIELLERHGMTYEKAQTPEANR